jgi:hypothetical protein
MVWHVFMLCSCLIGCIRSQCTSVGALHAADRDTSTIIHTTVASQCTGYVSLIQILTFLMIRFGKDWHAATIQTKSSLITEDWVIESTKYRKTHRATKARKRHPMRRCVMSSSSSDWSTVTGSWLLPGLSEEDYSTSRPTKPTSLLV